MSLEFVYCEQHPEVIIGTTGFGQHFISICPKCEDHKDFKTQMENSRWKDAGESGGAEL